MCVQTETSISVAGDKAVIDDVSSVEIQSTQSEDVGSGIDQVPVQGTHAPDPLELRPVIIDVQDSYGQPHF